MLFPSANGASFFMTQLFWEVGVGEYFVMGSFYRGAWNTHQGASVMQIIDGITLQGHLEIPRSPVQES